MSEKAHKSNANINTDTIISVKGHNIAFCLFLITINNAVLAFFMSNIITKANKSEEEIKGLLLFFIIYFILSLIFFTFIRKELVAINELVGNYSPWLEVVTSITIMPCLVFLYYLIPLFTLTQHWPFAFTLVFILVMCAIASVFWKKIFLLWLCLAFLIPSLLVLVMHFYYATDIPH